MLDVSDEKICDRDLRDWREVTWVNQTETDGLAWLYALVNACRHRGLPAPAADEGMWAMLAELGRGPEGDRICNPGLLADHLGLELNDDDVDARLAEGDIVEFQTPFKRWSHHAYVASSDDDSAILVGYYWRDEREVAFMPWENLEILRIWGVSP